MSLNFLVCVLPLGKCYMKINKTGNNYGITKVYYQNQCCHQIMVNDQKCQFIAQQFTELSNHQGTLPPKIYNELIKVVRKKALTIKYESVQG